MKRFLSLAAVAAFSMSLAACGGGDGGAGKDLAKNADCANQKQDENSRMSELQRKEADGTITAAEKTELDGIYATNKERAKTDGDCKPASSSTGSMSAEHPGA